MSRWMRFLSFLAFGPDAWHEDLGPDADDPIDEYRHAGGAA